MIKKVNMMEKFAVIENFYEPKEAARVNDMAVKMVKLKGPFTWHLHEDSDEMFMVVKGKLTIEIENQEPVDINENEFIVIPKGVKHRPNPVEEVLVALFEPADLLNTGNVVNEFTVEKVEKI